MTDPTTLYGDRADASVGTSLRGYVTATHDMLVAAFGDPSYGVGDSGDGKVDCEWVLVFPDGLLVTVYNYKDGPSYGGGPVEDITAWHVGGFGGHDDYVERVEACLAKVTADAERTAMLWYQDAKP